MKKTGDDYRDILEPGRKRRVLVYRALGACALAALLLLGLGLLRDNDESTAQVPAQQLAPLTLPTEPQVQDVQSDAQLTDGDAALAESVTQLDMVDEADEAVQGDIALEGDGALTNGGAAQETVTAPDVTDKPEAQTATTDFVEPPPTKPVPSAPPVATSRVEQRHVVRVGGFADPDSRQLLRDAIEAAGHRVVLQSRVSVGPFGDMDSAQAAMRQLEQSRRMRGLLIALDSDEYAVQLGVFSNVANAETMERGLQAWGYKVYRDSRLLVGPFSQLRQADTVAAEISLTLGEKTQIITGGGR